MSPKYISLKECKDRWLYIIDARNARKAQLGIFNNAHKSFWISHVKFNDNFIFEEYHWDTGAPHGTAKPLEEVEKALDSRESKEMLGYLNKKGVDLKDKIEEYQEGMTYGH